MNSDNKTTAGPGLWTQLQHRLEDEIALAEKEETTDAKIAARLYPYASELLLQLKSAVQGYTFLEGEEIHFYKTVKPYFHARVFFYSWLFKIETGKPKATNEGLYEYYKSELAQLGTIYQEHKFIHSYLESGSTLYDEKMFFRPHGESAIAMSGLRPPTDGAFPVCYDYVVGELLAANLLERHLFIQLDKLTQPSAAGVLPKLVFTFPKAAAIELCYALYARGCFNNGKAQLKDIVRVFEFAMGITMDNHPRTWQEMLRRKGGIAVFLDGSINSLQMYADECLDRQAG